MAPLTELVVISSMTDGAAARAIGDWFGTGADRGIALVFVVTGLVGLVVTLAALASPAYRRLTAAYAGSVDPSPQEATAAPAGRDARATA